MLVIVDVESKSLGVMGLAEAMTEARKRGLDLVEVNPAANPPVCKILDYGKYLYNLAKKEKDTRKNSAATKLKELNFHMNIDEHDYGVKMRHAEEFMFKGMKVKLQLKFRGREMMHQDIGMELIRRMRADLSQVGVADNEPKLIGKSINLMLSPLPARKRVRKFSHESETLPEEEEELKNDDSTPENGNGSH
ncbi:MAG: translation initiation factor IF-3 [Methylacidiphilales bacterium]|nr:translation initiation factor IF-3 [Candidatus Methylacidiphilales bacterium]